MVKLSRGKRQRILEEATEKGQVSYQGIPMRLWEDFTAGQVRRG
jgi:hypothetical protein